MVMTVKRMCSEAKLGRNNKGGVLEFNGLGIVGVMGIRWIRGERKWLIVHGRVLVIKLLVVRYVMMGVVLGEVMSDVRKSGATEGSMIGLAQVQLLVVVLLLLLLLLPFIVVGMIVDVDFTLVLFLGFWVVQLLEEGASRWWIVVICLRYPRVILDHGSCVRWKI